MENFTASCELCGGEAAIYCVPDAASLCWSCDADVHGANFLVACHVRRVACSSCRSVSDVSGPGGRRRRQDNYLCRACGPDAGAASPPSSPTASASSSSASSCRPTGSASGVRAEARRRRRAEVVEEEVLGGWSRRMGLRTRFPCVATAVRVLRESRGKIGALPMRVSLAGALWFGMKVCGEAAEGGGREAGLRRLGTCSGVPCRLIELAESRIARSAGRVGFVEEGWDEC